LIQPHLLITANLLKIKARKTNDSAKFEIPKELELLKQLSAGKIAQLGVNSQINVHIESNNDYLENNFWSF
jgi:hypothetical protein